MLNNKLSVGQAFSYLKRRHRLYKKDLAPLLHTSHTTLVKIERDEKELSFIMAVKLCRLCDMDINELVAMISEDEIERKEVTALRMEAKKGEKQTKKIEEKRSEISNLSSKHEIPKY